MKWFDGLTRGVQRKPSVSQTCCMMVGPDDAGQELGRASRKSLEKPEGTKRSHGKPGEAMKSKKEPGGAWSSQGG